jgi:hypothetical protein
VSRPFNDVVSTAGVSDELNIRMIMVLLLLLGGGLLESSSHSMRAGQIELIFYLYVIYLTTLSVAQMVNE